MSAKKRAASKPLTEYEQMVRDSAPNDLGDDKSWGWALNEPAARNLYWAHRCKEGRLALGIVEISTGLKHRVTSEDPLTVTPSLLCIECKTHGFIRDGRWEDA